MAGFQRRTPKAPTDNVVALADVREAEDYGHGQDAAMWREVMAIGGSVVSPDPSSLDPALARVLEADLGPIRERFIEHMRMTDANEGQPGARELHMHAAAALVHIDAMAEVLRREVGDQ